MIDPFTAVAAATAAFNTVKEFENCMGKRSYTLCP
jgi:hypothetical protein|tara:strand:+ start:1148 stop:1252 length:105 start_codon:yes stop_codon:yes gene_type:complete